MHTSKQEAVAKIISDLGSPIVTASLFLLAQPLLHPQIPWIQALVATVFVTLIPTAALILMRRRKIVGDMHVTERSERAPVLVVAAISIVSGALLLLLVNAELVLFQEIAGIFIGLAVCFAITMFWKVSIHSAVATYVALAVTASIPVIGPVVALLFSAVIGWSRIKVLHHTASQVLGGQVIGCCIYLVRVFFLNGS